MPLLRMLSQAVDHSFVVVTVGSLSNDAISGSGVVNIYFNELSSQGQSTRPPVKHHRAVITDSSDEES